MGWTVPGPHLVCSVLPVGAKLPFSDSVHSLGSVRLVEIEYEPSAHGSGLLAPAGQNEPGSQATHACLPSSAWYVPAAHLSQVSCFAMGWTFPGLHLVGSMLARRILASITQAGEIAPRATRARNTPHAPRRAVAALLACGRSDSGWCSAHVAGRADGGAQTAGLRQGIVAVAVHARCTCTR
eukprot:scaffold4416_cov65-Phaeocystis_antarctica.AAC.6